MKNDDNNNYYFKNSSFVFETVRKLCYQKKWCKRFNIDFIKLTSDKEDNDKASFLHVLEIYRYFTSDNEPDEIVNAQYVSKLNVT